MLFGGNAIKQLQARLDSFESARKNDQARLESLAKENEDLKVKISCLGEKGGQVSDETVTDIAAKVLAILVKDVEAKFTSLVTDKEFGIRLSPKQSEIMVQTIAKSTENVERRALETVLRNHEAQWVEDVRTRLASQVEVLLSAYQTKLDMLVKVEAEYTQKVEAIKQVLAQAAANEKSNGTSKGVFRAISGSARRL